MKRQTNRDYVAGLLLLFSIGIVLGFAINDWVRNRKAANSANAQTINGQQNE
jgi:hypothetical protein